MEILGARLQLPGPVTDRPPFRLRAGQLLKARVNSVRGEQVQLQLAGERSVQARSTVPLQVGQQLQLQVQGRSHEGSIIMQIVPGSARSAEDAAALGQLQRLNLPLTENNMLLARELENQGLPLTRAGLRFLSQSAGEDQLSALEARALVWLWQNGQPLEPALVRPLARLFSQTQLGQMSYLRETLREVARMLAPEQGERLPATQVLQQAVERLEQLVIHPGNNPQGHQIGRLLSFLGLDREARLYQTWGNHLGRGGEGGGGAAAGGHVPAASGPISFPAGLGETPSVQQVIQGLDQVLEPGEGQRPGPEIPELHDVKSRLLEAVEALREREQFNLAGRVEAAAEALTGLQLLQGAAASEQNYWDMHLLGWLFFPQAEVPWFLSARIPEEDGERDSAQELVFFTSPPSLGGIIVELRRWEQVLTCSLTAENARARDLAEAYRPWLTQSLQDLPYRVSVLPCRLHTGQSLRETWLRRVVGQNRLRQMDVRI